jgi:hypothetical protein
VLDTDEFLESKCIENCVNLMKEMIRYVLKRIHLLPEQTSKKCTRQTENRFTKMHSFIKIYYAKYWFLDFILRRFCKKFSPVFEKRSYLLLCQRRIVLSNTKHSSYLEWREYYETLLHIKRLKDAYNLRKNLR